MTRGRKPRYGISSGFFHEPTLIAIGDLSQNNVGEWVDYYRIEAHICGMLNIDIMWKGRQPQTNRPLVRVWIGGAISKIKTDGLIATNGPRAALTQAGLDEVNRLCERIKANPNTAPTIPPEMQGRPTPDSDQNSNIDDTSQGNPMTTNQPTVTAASPSQPTNTNQNEETRRKEEESMKVSEETRRLEEEKAKKFEAERKFNENVKKAAELKRARIRNGDAVDFAKILMEINKDVPVEDCLPMPLSYRIPTKGSPAKQLHEAAISLKNRRSCYIWGLPGSGKDAFIHAFSALTRTPAQIFTVSPNEDIQSWFYIRSFEKDGTSWEEGAFLKAVRDGYTTSSGRKMPYTILISDLDRATKNQAEALRLIMDTIQGRVMGPQGVKYPVFPGTQIVATGNSSGSGDSRGRCVSSNVIDASILDRFERKFKFDTLDWNDEEEILRKKFPTIDAKVPEIWANVGSAVKVLRKSVENESIFAEFGHRSVCSWVGHMQDILESEYEFHDKLTVDEVSGLLRRGSVVLIDAMPDDQTRLEVQRLLDPHIKGGVVLES